MADVPGGRVCVIGAGIAGLVTAKVLQEDGFEVTIFDKEDHFAGTWAPSRTYPGLRTNSPRQCYAFSDHPYPKTADEFPTAAQVREYLESYARRFGLIGRMRLYTPVLQVARAATGAQPQEAGFDVTVQAPGTAPQTEHFDFVAVCSGVFSQPNLPDIEGRAQFAGQVLHSSQVADPALFESQRVVVYGAGKSAADCAGFAARHGASSTLVFRRPHWMLPRYFFGCIRCDWTVITRLAEMMSPYHRLNRVETWLHGSGRSLVNGFWNGMSRLLRWTLAVPPGVLPEAPLPAGFESAGVGQDFYEMLQQGRVGTRHAGIAAFTGPREVQLDTGERLAADLVVCATGWQQTLPFLAPELHSRVRSAEHFTLYRHILPPGETRLGCIGFASSISCQLTAEVSAHWLSQCFRGELDLPPVEQMHQEIRRVADWAVRTMPARSQAYYIGGHAAHHADDLLRDMRLPTVRTSNFVSEYLVPFWSVRFANLAAQRRQARAQGAPVRRGFYLGLPQAAGAVGVLVLLAWVF